MCSQPRLALPACACVGVGVSPEEHQAVLTRRETAGRTLNFAHCLRGGGGSSLRQIGACVF